MLKCVRVFIVVKIDFKATILQIEFFCTSLQTHTHTKGTSFAFGLRIVLRISAEAINYQADFLLALCWRLPVAAVQPDCTVTLGDYSLVCAVRQLLRRFCQFPFFTVFLFAAVVSVTLADAGDGKLSTLV